MKNLPIYLKDLPGLGEGLRFMQGPYKYKISSVAAGGQVNFINENNGQTYSYPSIPRRVVHMGEMKIILRQGVDF